MLPDVLMCDNLIACLALDLTQQTRLTLAFMFLDVIVLKHFLTSTILVLTVQLNLVQDLHHIPGDR